MAITLNKIVNSPKEYASLADVRESILAAAKAAKEAERRDSVVIELDAGAYNLTEPFVLSATETPELSFVDITLRSKYAGQAKIQSLTRLDGKRFVRAEGKPYFTYQMEKDENGEYPRFHDLHLNFREIEMAKSPTWRNPDTLSPEERRGEKKKPGFYAPLSIAEPLAAFDIHGAEVMIYIEWQFCVVHAECVDLSDIREFDGEKYALKGRPYTTSDDGHCTRANLFNEWVTKVPRDKARVLYGDLTGVSPTLINRNDPVISHIESIYITFVYAPRK